MSNLQDLIQEQLKKDNFLIVKNLQDKNYSGEKYAVIYCSSNGVYKNDTIADFTKSILQIDNYEWFMTRIPYAEKHIFIRDISKRFYQFGINNNGLNSIEKIAEMLKEETKGYKIITIGSSAGGTAAIVLGKMLNADFTIAFSPMLKTYKEDIPKEIIEEKIKNKEYFDNVNYANSEVPIFYIYPNGSEWDIYNSSLVKDYKNVYFLPIESSIHGVPLNKRILKKILGTNKETLKNIFKYKTTDVISEYKFARENWGYLFYLQRIFDYIKKYPMFFIRKDFYNTVLK